MWVKQEEDDRLPEWLAKELNPMCPYCGSPKMNYYNEDDGRCTGRKCSNQNCPGMIAARADNMRQLLNIKDIGFAACLKDVKNNNITRPIELLRIWNIKPTVDVGLFLRLQCWEGVDSGLETEMQKYNIQSLDDLFERYDGKYIDMIRNHRDELYALSSLVTFKEATNVRKNAITHTIMITGTPNNFPTKEAFVEGLNAACDGRVITIHQKTARQGGVDYLICEPGTKTTRKVATAIKAGIPIVTSEQYMAILVTEIKNGKPVR